MQRVPRLAVYALHPEDISLYKRHEHIGELFWSKGLRELRYDIEVDCVGNFLSHLEVELEAAAHQEERPCIRSARICGLVPDHRHSA